MAIEHAVLGLLSIEPRHGYELSKEFSQDRVMGDIVHLESGMLYAHLKKLERRGWVGSELEPQEARPARKVFALTSEGEEELRGRHAIDVHQRSDQSEIEEGEPPAHRIEHDVARMRVGMEHSIDKDLLQVSLEKLFGQAPTVDLQPG